MSDTATPDASTEQPSGLGKAQTTPQRIPSSAFKARLAAFESGAAANSSSAKYDAAAALAAKGVTAADLGSLRSRFDKDDKPLVVKGSFGLGATASTGKDGSPGSHSGTERPVALGIGRAVSPMQAPSVIVPERQQSSPSLTSSLSSSRRPASLRSDSTLSTVSGTASAGSSLLPERVSSLMAHSGSAASDGVDTSGLRTPMSSISLSSMLVESGSVAGDSNTDRGSVAAPEDVSERHPETPSAAEEALTPGALENDDYLGSSATKPGDVLTEGDGVELSAAQLERKRQGSISQGAEDSTNDGNVTDGAVERAAKELEKYTLEEPREPAQAASTIEAVSLPLEQASSSSPGPLLSADSIESSAGRKSPQSLSRPASYVSGLRRSSTNASLRSEASQPEADLADANLDTFAAGDNDIPVTHTTALGTDMKGNSTPPAVSAGPVSPPATATDEEKAKFVLDSMVPTNSSGNESGEVTETTLAAGRDEPSDMPAEVGDESTEVDEDGMPLVKCSDCGKKLSLMSLSEHTCAKIASSPSTAKLSGREGVEMPDVPTSEHSASPAPSPAPAHRELPGSSVAHSHAQPDVPDDAVESVLDEYDDPAPRESPAGSSSLARDTSMDRRIYASNIADRGDPDEYHTALTSHRDSIDEGQIERPIMGRGHTSGNDEAFAVDDSQEEKEELSSYALSSTQADNGDGTAHHFADNKPSILNVGIKSRRADSPSPDKVAEPSPTASSLSPITDPHNRSPIPSLTPCMPLPPLSASSMSSSSSMDDFENSMANFPAGVKRSFSSSSRPARAEEPGTVTIIRQ